ncbi:sialin-like [Macrosteles quadrilineatus]|uniref:sialin-like n=1 Tax=Macrosteles quadrilineatus TaxID=74068 RepID=UPI0023E122C1|nr:sialin-like [Macrosteles quadrilineatus]XP_054273660.1 sialin-like [Macrosteles quadrilineatus]
MTQELTCEDGKKMPTDEGDMPGMFKKRYIQGYMLFFLFFVAFSLRLNLSVAIVAMTDSKSANPNFEELDWDLKTRSKVLSAFFWGYLVMQLPAGQLGQMFSVKQLLLVASGLCACLTLLTPVAATKGGWFLVCLLRGLQGLCQGFYVPLTYTVTSKWVPLHERNRFVGFALNGGTIGAVVSLSVSGILASSGGGWPSVFYVSGVVGLLWTCLWWWFGADSPSTHPTISPGEKEYILTALANSGQNQDLRTPWKAILTSVPVWALIGVTICNGWGFAIILTQLPAYINSVLGFQIQENGFLSALPYLSLWIFSFPVCWFADFLTKKKVFSTVVIRKLFTTICLVGGAVMVLSLCLVDRNAVAAMTLITIGITFTAFMFSGYNINHLDLSPNFAGVLMGLCNGLENVSTILAPLSVGWVVSDPTSVAQWRWVFIITAALACIGNAIFVFFGSADVQPWNYPDSSSRQTKTSNSTTEKY